MTTYQRVDTEMFADSVEWCPYNQYHTTLLCGTYQLQDEKSKNSPEHSSNSQLQVRLGHLRMYNLQISDVGSPQLELGCKLPMPGILDIKWCRRILDGCMVFGLVNSVGELQIWKFIDSDAEPSLLHKYRLDEQCLGLSMDWSSEKTSQKNRILTSDTKGCLSLFDVGNNDIHCLHHWKCHEFEAWICGFNHWNDNILYSGGDDCRLKCWDLRVGIDFPIFSKRFDMGVCSLQCNEIDSSCNIIAVGGYDEHLRLWDVRNWKIPLNETKLGGGIWRIKWNPFNGTQILTATMYNGFHLVDASNPGDSLPVILEYKDGEHGSLGYGADWCHLNTDDKSKKDPLISTCSFYDHSLHLWSYKMK